MSRQSQHKVMMKFATAVSRFNRQAKLIEKYLESPELPYASAWTNDQFLEVIQALEGMQDFKEKAIYFSRCIQEDFQAHKPTRITDEQLREMRYLFSVGVSKNKLTKRYKTTLKVLSKHLNQSTAGGENNE